MSLTSAVASPHGNNVLTELTTFPASQAYLADHSVLNSALHKISKCHGHLYTYHGVEVEDASTGYLVIGWKGDHHGECGDLNNLLEPAVAPGGHLDTQHIVFSVSLDHVLSAPLTEFATIVLKEGKSKDDLISLITNTLSPALDASAGSHPPSAWGASREKARTYVTIVGWDSLAAHEAALASPVFEPIVPAMLALVDGVNVHVQLNKY